MVNEQLLEYVKNELARGISEDKLRHVLMENGWPEFEINEAFEKAKEAKVKKPPEEVSKEAIPEQKIEDKTEEKPFKEFLEGLSEKEPKVEEARPEEKVAVEKLPIMGDVKKIITNKIFIIAAIVIVLSSVAFSILPSFFEETVKVEGVSDNAMDSARIKCKQICDASCGRLQDKNTFTDSEYPELEDKSCADLEFPCSKCETKY